MKNFVIGLVVGATLSTGAAYWMRQREVRFTTPFQAVLLDNNHVYYGKPFGYGTVHPILTEVYYVKSVLVKRGKELHGPDRMYLSTQHIVVVEPVGTGSQVAKLIEQSKND